MSIKLVAASAALLASLSLVSGASADPRGASAAKAQAAKIQMMKLRQARAAQASMAMATVTAATLAATDAGECSPYLAKWMMTRNPMWRVQYEVCMDD